MLIKINFLKHVPERWRKKRFLIPCSVLASLILVFILIPVPDPVFTPDYSTAVLDKNGRILRVFLNKREQWHFAPDDTLAIPEKLKKAVLLQEDRTFNWHPGINPAAVIRAAIQNLRARKTVSGASTITMQVARLMKPKRRNAAGKLLEMMQALKMEVLFSKKKILKLYLDHAPYGGNIVGYRAASLRYFRKMPEQLTWAEAATLAVLPNAPGVISPERSPGMLKRKRDRLLKLLAERGAIQAGEYENATDEPVPAESVAFGFEAPHWSQMLYETEGGAFVRSSLDADLQARAEQLLQDHGHHLKSRGIRNGAVLIAETGSGKIRVYVGSPSFFDYRSDGQVDGVLAPRSPGSLLKPFLYALSMDEGLILPETWIRDIPSFYGAYSPANASESYDGLVTAGDALIRSLNVPAVRLLNMYGIQPFYHFLKKANVPTLFRSADEYGLPLILGGAELRLWDMVSLFRGLGRMGLFDSLETLEDGAPSASGGTRLISAGACYLVLKILGELKRPGSEYYWDLYRNQWPLSWKTGTSYGQKDAWAVGVSPEWTIGVWIGNFDGQGNVNLSGAGSAGPVLFDLFNSLPRNPAKAWFREPAGELENIELCMDSGFRAGPDCEARRISQAPKWMKPLRLCPFHHAFRISSDGRFRVCSKCWIDGKYETVRKIVYPADVIQYMRERGQDIWNLPPHNPGCPALADQSLQILYPREDARLWIPVDFGGTLQRVTLRAAHPEADRTLYWYLDDRYVGTTQDRHVMPVSLTRGRHRVTVVDDLGDRASVSFHADRKADP
ncbi:penicillin-binding protein 1C [bacterium]|nr:penicillin-binding protein 1C [bacterium]